MIHHPHALYYNGELIGIITNPDPHGNIGTICECLSPDEGLADAIPIEENMGNLEKVGRLWMALQALEIPETITPSAHEEDLEDDD